MSDLQKKFKKVISDIEQNLKNKEDLEYVKTQIYNIYNIFLDEFDRLEENSTKKIDNIVARYKILEDRMNEIEDSISKIESDIYINENEEYSFDITCPYCDTEFSVDCSEELQKNVICPECNETIELDWNDEHDECSHDCHECGGECDHNHDEKDNEDDM